MRLIDADPVLAEIMDFIDEYSEVDGSGLHNPKWCAMEEAKDVILNAPAMDAVPVVQCKDCENWSYQECVADNICWCNKLEKFTWKNFFCADGERKSENE